MKIDTYAADAAFIRPKTDSAAGAPEKGSGENFAALVEEASKNAQSAAGAKEAQILQGSLNPASGLLSGGGLAQIQLSRLAAMAGASSVGQVTQEEALKQMEDTLSLLENYALALGDSENTLKDLSPLADELSLSAESLNSASQGLGAGDPLKELSSEAAALAAAEALKFRRGDFV